MKALQDLEELLSSFRQSEAELTRTRGLLEDATKRLKQIEAELDGMKVRAERAEAEVKRRGPLTTQDEAWLAQNRGEVDWISRPGFIRARVRVSGRGPYLAPTLSEAVKKARRR